MLLSWALAQGAPSSPVLSNISMMGLDTALLELANSFNIRVTRYADDITFSSANEFPSSLPERVLRLFDGTPWTVSKHKTHFAELPSRLKVHGLLVDGKSVKLTKGYRNKLRAYSHVMQSGSCRPQDVARLSGHIRYSRHIATYDTE
ncbi:reverse transcriptase domain-containing protein [Frigidibacter mobilis]|uniref:reverse transcriptase domain-containing protein n=1 Tax=Frigidibacter mobilis TaxID=1335048 RepID=UPI000A03A64C